MPQDLQFLLFGLIIVSGLFLLSVARLFLLSRSNRRLRAASVKLEKQVVLKELEAAGIHDDATSWRAKTRRQFEALRGEFSHRLRESDEGGVQALKAWEEGQRKELAGAREQMAELEEELAAKEMLRMQALECELAATRAEILSGRRQNAVLQRAVRLSRRRAAMGPVRKSAALRGVVRSA